MTRLRVSAVLVFVVALLSAPSMAQERDKSEERDRDARNRLQLKVGAAYDQGDFGSSETTRTFFTPVTLRYLGERFDVGVTGSWIYLDAPGDVVFVEGTPQRTDERRTSSRSTSGVGDTILRARYFLLDDAGRDSWTPSVAPFVKLKLPTGDEDKNLSTGQPDGGLGVEVDKSFGRIVVFGDASFTFMGDPPGQDFRDRPAASLGAGYDVTKDVTVAALLDWRRALVRGTDDPLELVGVVTIRVAPTLAVSPHAFVGLTDGSPDFGLGVEVSYRFGRW